jgi:hypothetical protein
MLEHVIIVKKHIEKKNGHTGGRYRQESDWLVYCHGPITGISQPRRPGDL